MELAEVVFKLNNFAPLDTSEPWDNVGLLVESPSSRNVLKMLLTNDLTMSVLEEAIGMSVDVILSYHPPIFNPLKKITSQNWKENIIRLCLVNGISIYSPHTCYDALNGGVNDWLIEAFGKGEIKPISSYKPKKSCSHLIKLRLLQEVGSGKEVLAELKTKFNEDIRIFHYNLDVDVICKQGDLPLVLATLFQDNFKRYLEHHSIIKLEEAPQPNTGMGRFSKLKEEITLGDAVKMVKKHLGLSHVRLAIKHGGTEGDKISTVAVCAGSGGSVLKFIEADLYLTGELSHHEVLDYTQRGMSVILTDHSNCERGYLASTLKPSLNNLLGDKIEIIVSKSDCDPLKVV